MLDPDRRRAIDRHVDRLLRAADARYRFPTPVENIVEAQRLRTAANDASPFAAGILAAAPAALREKMRIISHKVLAVLDRRDRLVYVDPDRLEVQQRFGRCHEVGHDVLPWHDERFYVDGMEQLAPHVRALYEQEANYAAAQLLLQRDVFLEVARSLQPGSDAVKDLAARFGCSIHATFRAYVEMNPTAVAGLVLARSPIGTSGDSYLFSVKAVFASECFTRLFPWLDDPPTTLSSIDYPDLAGLWDQLSRFSVSYEGHLWLPSRAGNALAINVELFSNSYSLFLLASWP